MVDAHRAAAPGLDRRAAGRLLGDVLAVRARHRLGDDHGAGRSARSPRRCSRARSSAIPLEPVQAVAAAVVVAAVLIALPGAFATLERRGATLRICIAACGFALDHGAQPPAGRRGRVDDRDLRRAHDRRGPYLSDRYYCRATSRCASRPSSSCARLRHGPLPAGDRGGAPRQPDGRADGAGDDAADGPSASRPMRHGRRPSPRVAACAVAVLAGVALLGLESAGGGGSRCGGGRPLADPSIRAQIGA